MRYVVEEFGKVYIDYPLISIVEELKTSHNCHLGTAVWPESIRGFREENVGLGGHCLRYRLLYHPVPCRRDSELPHSAAGLGYFPPPDRCGFVSPVPDCLPDFISMRREKLRELFGFHSVHSGGALVGHDGLDGSFNVRFV